MRETYGRLLPEMRLGDLAGKLIVIEGTDGAGRSTQIDLLKPWLEELGHAVVDTGMTRSPLAGEGIRRAKEGNNLGRVTQALFYATDFVDRLENEIVPALRAGFIVLTDRYVYSLMARAIVRGMDPRWIRSIYSVALKPDAVFYLRLGIDELLPRVVFSRGFDYWESGMDLYPGHDMFDSFCSYQSRAAHRIRPPQRRIQFPNGGCRGRRPHRLCPSAKKYSASARTRFTQKLYLASLQRFHRSAATSRHGRVRRSSSSDNAKHKRQRQWPPPRRTPRPLAAELCSGRPPFRRA